MPKRAGSSVVRAIADEDFAEQNVVAGGGIGAGHRIGTVDLRRDSAGSGGDPPGGLAAADSDRVADTEAEADPSLRLAARSSPLGFAHSLLGGLTRTQR